MSIVISSDKHYKDIAKKIKHILKNETGYKPSEMAAAIANLRNEAEFFEPIDNGVVFSDDTPIFMGEQLYTGMLAGSKAESVTIPESFTELPPYMFAGSSIKNIYFNDNITKIDNYCFTYCENLKSLKLPENLTTIGDGSFAYCMNLKSLELPNKLTSIGMGAFTGIGFTGYDSPFFNPNMGIDKLIIPESVESIGMGAFMLSQIKVIELPKQIAAIHGTTFGGNFVLKALIIRREESICELASKDILASLLPILGNTPYCYVPSALIETYRTAENWSDSSFIFRPLEQYTVDGTTTGEFDYSKI